MATTTKVRKFDATTVYVERAIGVLSTAYSVARPAFRVHPSYPAPTRTVASFEAVDYGRRPVITLNRPSGGVPFDEVAAHEFQHYLDHLAGVHEGHWQHSPAFYARVAAVKATLHTSF